MTFGIDDGVKRYGGWFEAQARQRAIDEAVRLFCRQWPYWTRCVALGAGCLTHADVQSIRAEFRRIMADWSNESKMEKLP